MIAMFQQFISRLRAVFNKPALDADFSAELAQHLQAATADNIRAGLTPDEARRKAHIALGGVEQIRELHREARGLPSLENLARDIGFGLAMAGKIQGQPVRKPQARKAHSLTVLISGASTAFMPTT